MANLPGAMPGGFAFTAHDDAISAPQGQAGVIRSVVGAP